MSSKKARRRERQDQKQEGRRTGLSPATLFILAIGAALVVIVVASVVFGDRPGRDEAPWPGAVWSPAHGHWH